MRGVSEFDREVTIMGRPWSTRGCCVIGGGGVNLYMYVCMCVYVCVCIEYIYIRLMHGIWII